MTTRYHPNPHYATPANAGPAIDRGVHQVGRHEKDDSFSDDDHASLAHAHLDGAAPKDDAAAADDESSNLALIAQTLNADGTPKRPMNAFMIFARKRRPQIAAANQMMRTGDVSKILSKEWNTMEMSDKKFYLDQAKKLKDNFNNKYPDYVYRRRPNNSRKKRKPEASADEHDLGHLGDPDDAAYDETSPVDGEDNLMVPSPQDAQYTGRAGSSLYPTAHFLGGAQPAPPCTYPYSPAAELHSSHLLQQAHFAPAHAFPPSSVRTSPLSDPGSTVYPGPSAYHQNAHGSGNGGGAPLYGAYGLWEPTKPGGARAELPPRSNWPVLPALDTNVARHKAARADTYSPQLPHRPWSSATSSTASSSSGASASHQFGAGTNAFPTLNSPFYPGAKPGADAQGQGQGQGQQDFYTSPGARPSPYSSAPPHHDAAAWPAQYRTAAQTHRVASLSEYTLHASPADVGPAAPPRSTAGAQPLGYWEGRFGGR